jgi:hypothetical protein
MGLSAWAGDAQRNPQMTMISLSVKMRSLEEKHLLLDESRRTAGHLLCRCETNK